MWRIIVVVAVAAVEEVPCRVELHSIMPPIVAEYRQARDRPRYKTRENHRQRRTTQTTSLCPGSQLARPGEPGSNDRQVIVEAYQYMSVRYSQ